MALFNLLVLSGGAWLAVRGTITAETWEALNAAWLEARTRAAHVRPSTPPRENSAFLEFVKDRATREALFNASWTRAARGDANDTRAIISELARLRAQKAKLLGYPNYAAYVLYDQMAQTPQAVENIDAIAAVDGVDVTGAAEIDDAGDLRGDDVHDDAAGVDRAPTGHIQAHSIDRYPFFGDRGADFNCRCFAISNLV